MAIDQSSLNTTMRVSLSDAFTNKTINPGYPGSAMATSFIASQPTVKAFCDHVTAGKAWAVGHYEGDNRSKNAFLRSNVLALDLDDKGMSVADCLKNADIRRRACLIHPSPNSSEAHPRTRVVFVLDTEITDRVGWEKYQQALIWKFRDMQPDKSCKDAARFYYGSDRGKAHINLEAVLPVASLDKVVVEWEAAQAEELEATRADAPAAILSNDDKQKATTNIYNHVLKQLHETSSYRNVALNKAAFFLFGCARGSWGFNDAAIERDLTNAAVATGLEKAAIAATIRSAKNAAVAIPFTAREDTQYYDNWKNDSTVKEQARDYQATTIAGLSSGIKQLFRGIKTDSLSTDQIEFVVEEVQSGLDSLLSMSGKAQTISGSIANQRAFAMVQERMKNPQWILGMKSNLTALDKGIGGFAPGQFTLFEAGTATGKTTLIATLAYHFGLQSPGIVLSCENTEPVFMIKMGASICQIPFGYILRGGQPNIYKDTFQRERMGDMVSFTPEEQGRIKSAMGAVQVAMDKGTQIISSEVSPTPSMIRSIMRQNPQAQWLLVDSLNNIPLPYFATEYETTSRAALLCEELAVKYNIPVIGTAQIGRNTKHRPDKEPGLHDGRGSGLLEEKAATVISMYNHWYHVARGEIEPNEKDYKQGTVSFRVQKLRDGMQGIKFPLCYIGGCGFYND